MDRTFDSIRYTARLWYNVNCVSETVYPKVYRAGVLNVIYQI